MYNNHLDTYVLHDCVQFKLGLYAIIECLAVLIECIITECNSKGLIVTMIMSIAKHIVNL